MHEHHRALLAEPRFWVAVSFTIFFAIFFPKLWRAITKLLDDRAHAIRAELDEAGRLRREAESMLADATRRRDAAIGEAQALLESAKTEASRLAESARTEAETTARRRERMALDRIAAAEKAAVNEVRVAAAEVAAQAAEQIIARDFSAEAGSAMLDRAIAGLPAAFSARRAA